jgi:hypothetical protein
MLLLVDDIDIYTLISKMNKYVTNIQTVALAKDEKTEHLANGHKHDNDFLVSSGSFPVKQMQTQTTIDSNRSSSTLAKETGTQGTATAHIGPMISEHKKSLSGNKDNITDVLMKANKKVYETSDRFQQVAYANGKKSKANGYNTLPQKLLDNEVMNTKPVKEVSKIVTNLMKTNETDSVTDTNFAITIPQEKDTLFWCFYNLVYGKSAKAYEFIQNTCETEQETRFLFIDVIRSNKDVIKPLKISRTNIEENIIHDKNLNIRSVIALAHSLRCMNLVYISGRTYHEVMLDESFPCHLIQKHVDKEKYGYCMNITSEQVEEIHASLWHMENMDKPMKSISSYKADDLRYICTQLQLEFKEDDKCTKPVMYERIMQYLSA